VWYGVCARNGTKIKNCVYNGRPKTVDSTEFEILREICPNLLANNETKFCCDSEQINDLAISFEMAANLLQRCPSCYGNFLQIFCEFTCSPHQKKFIDVKKIIKLEPENQRELLTIN
jgi:Niemann-Pick C1 protein